MEKRFRVGELSDTFPALEKLQDFALIPLLDVIVTLFIEHIKSNCAVYRITDYYFNDNEFVFVMDGRIVRMTIAQRDIDTADDEYWWMVESVSFNGSAHADNKAFNTFMEFIEKQDLEILRQAAAAELNKGKTCHLSNEMHRYYFENYIPTHTK